LALISVGLGCTPAHQHTHALTAAASRRLGLTAPHDKHSPC
jgi:hypothetical protein